MSLEARDPPRPYQDVEPVDGRSALVRQERGKNAVLIPFDREDGASRLSEPEDEPALKARVRHAYTAHSLAQRRLERAAEAGGTDEKRALGAAMASRDEDLEERIHDDANWRFLAWVAGHLGIDDTKVLLAGFRDRHAAVRFHEEGEGVCWSRGERRLAEEGRIVLKPTLVSARDDAYSKIRSMACWLEMDAMVREPGLNELFARLTAAIYRDIIQGNPKRYFTTRDRAKVNSDVMSVRVGLKAFFRAHPHLTRRGRRGIYDFV